MSYLRPIFTRLLSLSYGAILTTTYRFPEVLILKNGIFSSYYPLRIITRLKVYSKSASREGKSGVVKEQIPQALLMDINADGLEKDFGEVLNHFSNVLLPRLALKITPQILADIMVPGSSERLGQVANLIVQSSKGRSPGDQTLLLVDLSGRPDLYLKARKAVGHFLETTSRGSAASLSNAAGPTAFTVPLSTVVTKAAREDLIRRGHDMLNNVKRDMNKVYQSHDKLIIGHPELKRRFSEDDLFNAREYLRSAVKKYHGYADKLWSVKLSELKSNS